MDTSYWSSRRALRPRSFCSFRQSLLDKMATAVEWVSSSHSNHVHARRWGNGCFSGHTCTLEAYSPSAFVDGVLGFLDCTYPSSSRFAYLGFHRAFCKLGRPSRFVLYL